MQKKIRNSFILLFSAVIAALLLACAFMLTPKTTAHADAEETHDHSTMTELSASGTLTAGSYYLGDNISGNLTVSGEVTLCLNGHTVTGSGTNSVITVSENASLTLCDCQGTGIITGGTGKRKSYHNALGPANYGGGVFVEDYGTFTMIGGKISGNTANYGGGVCVYDYGAFTMTGGEITDNSGGTGGGGVFVLGSFEMENGTISGNSTSDSGGGVCVSRENNGVFEMTGGTISDNTADYDGGGVCVGFPIKEGEMAESLTVSKY